MRLSKLKAYVTEEDGSECTRAPPVGGLLLALDVQLAEEEPLVLGRVCRRLGHGRAALGRRRPRPPCLPAGAGLLRSWPAPGLRSVSRPRPLRSGRLLWEAIGKARDLAPGLWRTVRSDYIHANTKEEGSITPSLHS